MNNPQNSPVPAVPTDLKELKYEVTAGLRSLSERMGINFDDLCDDAKLLTTENYNIPCLTGTTSCRWLFKTDDIGVAKYCAGAGTRIVKHHHVEYKTLTVVSGTVNLMLDKMCTVLHAGDACSVPPNMPHEIFTPEETVYLTVAIPPFKVLSKLTPSGT